MIRPSWGRARRCAGRVAATAICSAGLGLWSPLNAAPEASAGSTQSLALSADAGSLGWTAASWIVGQTSTGNVASGGDSRYAASMPLYSGVAALLMSFSNPGSTFICTGSLLPDRRSILTAAHCLQGDASRGSLLNTSVYFYGGSNPDTVVTQSPLATAMAASQVFLHPSYSANTVDQNDIAIVRLASVAPAFATSYGLSGLTDLSGVNFNVAGYGLRSSSGGSGGFSTSLSTGVLRQGDNRFEFRMGDPAFGNFWSSVLSRPLAEIEQVYLADFDSGAPANDSACRLFGACDQGRGATEASTAPGDSGGPLFDASMNLAAVTSFGLTFGSSFGDSLAGLNSSWGEFAGFVPVSYHLSFIQSHLVQSAPGPVPIAGALMTVTLSRRLRRRIQAARRRP